MQVAQGIGDSKCLRQDALRLLRRTERVKQAGAETDLQPHLEPSIRYLFGLELQQRMLASLAALGRERQIQPHRRIGGSELRSDDRVTGLCKGPVERCSNVVDLLSGVSQPSIRRSCHGLSFQALEKISVVLGMAARDTFALAALVKLLQRVRAYRVEQPPATGRYRSVQRHQ